MTRPDWVPEALWEKAEAAWREANMHSVHDAAPYGPHAIALALLQAKNEGKREAARLVETMSDALYEKADAAGIDGRDDAFAAWLTANTAQAILSSIQKEPK